MGGCSERSSIVTGRALGTARIHQPVQTDLGAHCDTIVSVANVAFQELYKSILETVCFKLTQQQWWVQGVERLSHISGKNVHNKTLVPCLLPCLNEGNQ